MLSPWLEEMAHDLLRVVHGYAVPRDAANDDDAGAAAAVTDGGEAGQWVPRTAKPEAAPAWLSAAQRELDGAPQGEDAAPAEGEDATKNNGKHGGKQNGKRK